MFKRTGFFIVATAWLLLPLAAAAAPATQMLARYKAASGGDRWDDTHSLRSRGSLRTGGLDGHFESLLDLATGRSTSHYELGPVEGAEGYDGTAGWSRDPGGEVASLDAPEARRRARSQAWLDARGYWYPQRMAARLGDAEPRELEGRRYLVIEATPQDGEPLALWFDQQTGLLARTVQRLERDTSTTLFDDYREVDGLRLPFHMTSDLTDFSGHTDPRSHSEMQLTAVTRNVPASDDDFARPQATAVARIANASGVTRVPFELASNHIYVDGLVDGRKARFLVDTGGVNLLTPAAAKKFGLQGAGKLAARGVGEKNVDLALARAGEVRVGEATLDKPVFYVVDLGSLAAVEGVEADGLVGYEMFSRFGVTIDYARRELTLATPAKFQVPDGAHAIPFEFADRIPIVDGTLDGLAVRLSIDTGSRVSLTLHSPFVRGHDLVSRYRPAAEAITGWGVGGPTRTRPARFDTLRIGDLDIGGVAGDLFTGDKGAFSSTDQSGNIGGGLLKRFTVAFDYARRRMYLAPNAAFAAADDFDRSGLFLLADGDGLKVADVAAGSAAAASGLEVEDRIVAIDSMPVATRTLEQWRQLLRESAAGAKLSIRYERDSKQQQATLVLADRIPPIAPMRRQP